MQTKTVKIHHRWRSTACWEGEIEDRGSDRLNLGEAIKRALASGAVLRGADLSGADLSGAVLSDAVLRGAVLRGADLSGAVLSSAVLRGAVLSSAVLRGADLSGADLSGAVLSDADLRGADLSGAVLRGAVLRGVVKIRALRVLTGLYRYQIWAFVAEDGRPWVRMGCLIKTVEDWDKIGIKASNPGEFPDDGSRKSEQRARAFEFARAEALIMAEEARQDDAK